MSAHVVPGFAEAVFDAQASFRALLEAMSLPGSVRRLPEPASVQGVAPAVTACCLALLDADTPLWLDAAARRTALAPHLVFHCGCPLTDDPGSAAFAVALDAAALPPLDDFALGSDPFPERSTTVLLQVTGLTRQGAHRVRGPGVDGERRFGIEGVPASLWAELALNAERYPCGVDVVLAAGAGVIALPRTARLEA